ncbi:hypothetical protein DFH27DRAFT_3603 [Peziza echinospora]|nr:hypothetical protein DFH27DRAFT_3603 [Peziza echinospora]
MPASSQLMELTRGQPLVGMRSVSARGLFIWFLIALLCLSRCVLPGRRWPGIAAVDCRSNVARLMPQMPPPEHIARGGRPEHGYAIVTAGASVPILFGRGCFAYYYN